MRRAFAEPLPIILVLMLALSATAHGRRRVTLVGDDIPARYYIGTSFIFDGSDSLFLNGRMLTREVDYTFDGRLGSFDFSGIDHVADDTLLVIYNPVPSWLKAAYGRPLPEVTPAAGRPGPTPIPVTRSDRRADKSDISISGAKTFRVTARSAGSSDFSQSLDMNIAGNLSPGLELTGSISDRGYDPSYGTANSRLSEIDKLNLTLRSKAFAARVGDITLDRGTAGTSWDKRISGAAVDLKLSTATFNAAAARPRGRFESVGFLGRDGVQGPYQITAGPSTNAIVPGSENVWLDGRSLERGANKDYTIDYPAGQITFNVSHPIDARSRIEVDYEPSLTAFDGELYATGGSLSLGDSTVNFTAQFVREGDDEDQPLTGELSAAALDMLSSVGDATDDALVSGVRTDSLGSYILVADSLPDSVYQYVGPDRGDYSVTFTYFGPRAGDYAFLGGSQYRYVGPGNGEYRPLILLPAPERVDYYQTSVSLRGLVFSETKAEFQQSRHDGNLLSSLDDGDNAASFFNLSAVQRWESHRQPNSLALATRFRQPQFKSRRRLDDADFSRTYLMPQGFIAATDEYKHDGRISLTLHDNLSVAPRFSRLSYENAFTSTVAGADASLRLSSNLQIGTSANAVRADLDTLGSDRTASADIYGASIKYAAAVALNLSADYEYDSRRNDYTGENRGTRYHRARLAIDRAFERFDYELFIEDTLSGGWRQKLGRNRLSAASERRLGELSYTAALSYQWLNLGEADEDGFLARLNLDYDNTIRRLGIGASYVVSEETRRSQGITYLEVERGEGDFILENGEFVPDPDGNYVRVEEILSEQAGVRRGEKSFRFSKTWPAAQLRFNSNIREELLPDGRRELWWVVPFLSDRTQPNLFYLRRYDADLRLLPIRQGHAVNFRYSEDREIRRVGAVPRPRSDFRGALVLKQVHGSAFFDESVELFRSDRDQYYSGGGLVEGYRLSVGYRRLIGSHEAVARSGFRRADADTGVRSKTVSLTLLSNLQIIKKAQLRSELEVYRQTLDGPAADLSFVLTDNRPGEKGALWSVSLRYGVKNGMRVNFSISGRHSNDRTARVTGRGEFVAGF
ncbi:MAG: hypothetical protein JSW34_13205 [Candidatus Zixiibacteriota bacterium]|nr:MAG: hypothetical protein JSW34_13205 [candidate division Zixibacteria bacterium]